MGYWKSRLLEADENGLNQGSADGKFVCADCFMDQSLQRVVQEALETDTCSFCGAESDTAIAAPLETVLAHVVQCLLQLYEDPANGMRFETAEGGYQGDTFDTSDLLDRIGMVDYLTEESEGPLLDSIRVCLENRAWCEKDPYALREHEALSSSWQSFCEFIKHERRFFFLNEQPAYSEESFELLDPGSLLRSIVDHALKLNLITPLVKGTKVFRVRKQVGDTPFRTALELGAPPSDKAVQANRMSPPGIVMTYVSEDAETAFAETADEGGTFSLGEFELARGAAVFDLTNVPEVPSIFDLDCAHQREAIIFLRKFAKDVSKPIERDARQGGFHVDYVPTQVVTEYIRVSPALREAEIEGIRFASSRIKDGVSLVLFGGRDLLRLEKSEMQELTAQEERASEKRPPLLLLAAVSSRTVL